jgi:hypothetical protein
MRANPAIPARSPASVTHLSVNHILSCWTATVKLALVVLLALFFPPRLYVLRDILRMNCLSRHVKCAAIATLRPWVRRSAKRPVRLLEACRLNSRGGLIHHASPLLYIMDYSSIRQLDGRMPSRLGQEGIGCHASRLTHRAGSSGGC